MADVLDKCKWVFLAIGKLGKAKFSGTLVLSFHEGNLSKKYYVKETHSADDL